MKAKIVLTVMVLMGFMACQSQDVKPDKPKEVKKGPNEEISVHRTYDKQGNLIALDSTYTSYYSNYSGDTIDVDSVMNDFGMYFENHFSGMDPGFFNSMDSTATAKFFQDDFFEQEFFNQEKQMLDMMNKMDSIKNEFFKKHASKKTAML